MSSTTRAIPVLKDTRGNDINFSTSLGGTLYGTTPGGTKRIYDRTTLLHYRNSPLSKTPPPELLGAIDMIKSPANIQTKQPQQPTKAPTSTTPPKPSDDDPFIDS
eukprot:gene1187-1500_t